MTHIKSNEKLLQKNKADFDNAYVRIDANNKLRAIWNVSFKNNNFFSFLEEGEHIEFPFGIDYDPVSFEITQEKSKNS